MGETLPTSLFREEVGGGGSWWEFKVKEFEFLLYMGSEECDLPLYTEPPPREECDFPTPSLGKAGEGSGPTIQLLPASIRLTEGIEASFDILSRGIEAMQMSSHWA